ncbi:MAG: hypothetical protein RBJ76_12050 [Stenomitos frigidus ULC029]
MQPQKAQKIDLTQSYPCPCRRRGQLTQIALTEAFGCNRCQQIFVVEQDGYVLEELSTSYRYKRTWRWNGYQWQSASSGFGESSLSIALGIVLTILIIGLLLALGSPSSSGLMFWAIVLLLLALLPALMVLLAYRR